MTTLERIQRAACEILPRYDVKRAYLFGSHARGDAGTGSDIDIRIVRGEHIDFAGLDNIRLDFEACTNTPVDVICGREKDFDADFLAGMERDQVLVYER